MTAPPTATRTRVLAPRPVTLPDAPAEPQGMFRARRRPVVACLVLAGTLLAAMVVATGTGAMKISPAQVLAILLHPLALDLPVAYDVPQAGVLWLLRLPRVILAVLVGGGLALSGASMQGMFRNPLADPALTGVSSGAALGAVSSIVFAGALGFRALPLWALPVSAFAGGLSATALVSRLGRSGVGTSVAGLLLAGIAVNAFCGAGIGLATFVANDAQLRSITFWSLGSLGAANWPTCALLFPLTLGCGWVLTRQSRVLNALLLGESEAGHLGFHVETGKRLLLACTALLVGVSVSVVGIVGFIGLVAPHLSRLALGPDHRTLLPVSTLLGAILLLVADTLCRTVATPAEIPVGVATALLGAPFFLWLLRRERRAA